MNVLENLIVRWGHRLVGSVGERKIVYFEFSFFLYSATQEEFRMRTFEYNSVTECRKAKSNIDTNETNVTGMGK